MPKGADLAAPLEEIILQKSTFADFFCDLYPVNWSDKKSIFYWADHDACRLNAIPVEGSLTAINYVEGKPPAKAAPTDDPNVEYLPSIFTVQLGFGLRRSHSVNF